MAQKPPDLDATGRPFNTGKPPDLDDKHNPIIQAQPNQLDTNLNDINAQLNTFLAESKDVANRPTVPDMDGPEMEMYKDETDGNWKYRPVQPVVDDRSLLRKGWDWASQPLTTLPSDIANKVSQYIDPNRGSTGLRSIASAYVEGLGGALSGLSSPLNLAQTATGVGGPMAAARGLTKTGNALAQATRGLSYPVAAQGAYHMANADNWEGFLSGGLETAMGVAGSAYKLPNDEIPRLDMLEYPGKAPEGFTPKSSLSRPEYSSKTIPANPRTFAEPRTLEEAIAQAEAQFQPSNISGPKLAQIGTEIINSEPIPSLDLPLSTEPPVLDASGRVVAPAQTHMQLRPQGPWDANNTIDFPDPKLVNFYKELDIAQKEAQAARFKSEIPNSPNDSPYNPGPPINVVPQFNPRGETGLTGNLQRIGEDIVNPQTGEILPPEQYTVTPDMDLVQAAIVKDTQRMKDDAYRASQDPVKVAEQKKTLSDWETQQRSLRINDFIEKNMPVDPETGFAKSYDQLTPAEQQFRDNLFNKIDKSDLTVENPTRDNNFKTRLVNSIGNEINITDFANDINTPSQASEISGSTQSDMAMSEANDMSSKIGRFFKDEKGELDVDALLGKKKKSTAAKTTETKSDAIGTTIQLKKPSVKSIKELYEKGYQQTGIRDDGAWTFKKVTGGRKAPVLETEVGNITPTAARAREQLGPAIDEAVPMSVQIFNSPRTLMASTDMSAPLRQGLPLALKPEFWKALPTMVKSWKSEEFFNAAQAEIANKPLFKKRAGPNGEVIESFADQAGLKLTDIHGSLGNTEEAFLASYLSQIPGVKHSNRAYVSFLNKLRADTFESLVKDGKVFGANAEVNVPLARALADFVNVATGRGSLGQLEPAAKILSNTFFAPRLIASRLKLMNPHYYWAAPPQVRKEALKALFTVAGSGLAIGQLARAAGGQVSGDRNSSDFGKIRFGNVHIDPFAGFQQYIVAASRLQSGKSTSTTTGNTYNLGEKFGRPTRLDVLSRFGESKLNPVITFGIDLLRAKDFTGQPINVPEEVAQRFVPLVIQDIKELLTEDPNLIPGIHKKPAYATKLHPKNLLAAPGAFFGQGVQVYKGRYR